MKYYLLFFQITLTSVIFSQSTLSVFNNGGQQFYVILNGIKQNSVPQTNVTVSGIQNGSYSAKIIFADGKTRDIDKNFFIEEPSIITTRVVFKKGKGKLQLIGMEPVGAQAPAQNAVVYRPNDQSVFSDAPVTVQTTNQSTQTINQQVNSTNNQPGNVGINMNVNVKDPTLNNGQGGMNVSVNMTGMDTQSQQTTQNTSVTTTTTTTSTSIGTNASNTTMQANQQQTVTNSQTVASVKCQHILSDEQKLIAELKKLTFEQDRKEQLEKDVLSHCMTAAQAYKLIEIFTFEADRLELAKYLYLRTIDKEAAVSKFMDLFTFDSNKVEFREYCRTVK